MNGERIVVSPPYDVDDPIFETNYFTGAYTINPQIDTSKSPDKDDINSPYYTDDISVKIHKGMRVYDDGTVADAYGLEMQREPVNLSTMDIYQVVYEANGGEKDWQTPFYYEVGEQGTVHNGTGFNNLGKTIKSWNTKPDGTGQEYQLGETTAFDKDGAAPKKDETITLYAQWEASYYEIKFDANGMTWKDGAYDDNGVEHSDGESIDFSSKTVYGTNPDTDRKQSPYLDFDYTLNYPSGNDTFLGWSTTPNGKAVTVQPDEFGEIDVSQLGINVGDSITLYAIFGSSANTTTYDIVYNANGGTGTINAQTGVNVGDTVTLSDGGDFSYANHRLLGWSTNAQDTSKQFDLKGKTDFNGIAQAGQTIMLYAIWEETYSLKYDTSSATSGSIADKTDIGVSESIILDDGSSIKKDGYDL